MVEAKDHLRIFFGSLSHKFPTQPNQGRTGMILGVITLFTARRTDRSGKDNAALAGKVAASYIIKGDAGEVVWRLYRTRSSKWKSLLEKMVAPSSPTKTWWSGRKERQK